MVLTCLDLTSSLGYWILILFLVPGRPSVISSLPPCHPPPADPSANASAAARTSAAWSRRTTGCKWHAAEACARHSGTSRDHAKAVKWQYDPLRGMCKHSSAFYLLLRSDSMALLAPNEATNEADSKAPNISRHHLTS